MYTQEKSIGHRIWQSALTLGIGLFFLVPASAGAATLSLVPSSASVSVGNTITVSVYVDSEGTAINNAEGNLSFLKNLFDVVSINKDASLFTLWIAAPAYDGNSTISFNGGLPSPGYQGSNGKLFSVILRAKAAGSAALTLVNGAVRANDGLGTDVLNSVRGATITIVQPAVAPPSTLSPATQTDTPVSTENTLGITSDSHPDQTKWYANSTPEFSWELPEGALEVRTLISRSSSAIPSVSYTPPISTKQVDNLPDGTYYFSLRVRTADGWGAISRYRVNIDATPPKPFSISFPHGAKGFQPQPIVYFNTTDDVSGVSHYDIKIGDDEEIPKIAPDAVSNPYLLTPQLPGAHTLFVTAIDKAGNTRSASAEFTIEGIDAPTITYYPDKIESGDTVKIRGTTYPNADINVYIREGDRLISEEKTKSNSLGDFILVNTKQLDPGVYTFTARVTDERGARSNETIPLTISVQSKFISGLIDIALKYLSAAILVLLALGSLVWIGVRLWFKIPRTIAHMRREAREAEAKSAHAFKVLRDSVARHITRLKKTNRKLTKEELDFLEEFEDKLGEAEGMITKEIRDISDS